MITAYLIHLLIIFAIVAIAALGLQIAYGFAGLPQFGFIGVMAIASYTSALLAVDAGWSVSLSVLMGVVAGSISSLLLGIAITRLRGESVGVVLLGFTYSIYNIAENWTSVTHGALGIAGVPRLFGFTEDRWFLLLLLLFLACSMWFVSRLSRSPLGRVMSAVRDDATEARVLGKHADRSRLIAMFFSGLFASLAGILLGQAIQFVDPNGFFLELLVLVVSSVLIGGLGSVRGALWGAALTVLLPELVSSAFASGSAEVGAIRSIIFSALLILVLIKRPQGLFGTLL